MESTNEITPQGSGAQTSFMSSARRPFLKFAIMALIAFAFISTQTHRALVCDRAKAVHCSAFDATPSSNLPQLTLNRVFFRRTGRG